MKNLIQNTIGKIKSQHIVPEPRWRYLVKKYGLWLLLGVILILAAISLSAAHDNTSKLDWDLYRFMRQNRIIYYLSLIPYVWVILIVVFLAAALFEIRKTETGYRYSRLGIFGIIIGGITAMGILMSFFGFGGRFNSMMAKNLPYYGQHMMVTKESQWMQPEKGFLAGTIQSGAEQSLELGDLDGKRWEIPLNDKTLVRPSVRVIEGEMIKIIGKVKGDNVFEAVEIRPWMGRGMMRGGGMLNGQNQRMMKGGQGMMQGR